MTSIWLYISIFISSFLVLYWAGSRLIKSLERVCRFLGWREFVVAFFIMSIATSLPNLFIDINAAIQNMPQLAFGDIVGGNIMDLTLIVGLAIIIGNINLPANSKMVQSTAFFTVAIAIIPLALIMDAKIDRIDGLILILSFFLYAMWLFHKKGRFSKDYEGEGVNSRDFFKNLGGLFVFLIFILISSQGIVLSAQYFSSYFNVSLPLVGIFLLAVSNCAPEGYFSIISAKKKENWMVLGNLMGSVIFCSTIVLGIVALIRPFEITDVSVFASARIFLIFSALFFLIALRTGRTITKKEGAFLILFYFIFLIFELCFKNIL